MKKVSSSTAAHWAARAINRQLADRGIAETAEVQYLGLAAAVEVKLPGQGWTQILQITGTRTRHDQTRVELAAVKSLRLVTGWTA